MEQKIEALSAEDAAHTEKQRAWVRDHYDEGARHNYESIEGKLKLLDTILRSGWVEPQETWKLQSLGVTFGDAIAQMLGLRWVAVEDEHGRTAALQDPKTTIVVFPVTAISKRVERGEQVDVNELFDTFFEQITDLRYVADTN